MTTKPALQKVLTEILRKINITTRAWERKELLEELISR
jgi:hypothetical protein